MCSILVSFVNFNVSIIIIITVWWGLVKEVESTNRLSHRFYVIIVWSSSIILNKSCKFNFVIYFLPPLKFILIKHYWIFDGDVKVYSLNSWYLNWQYKTLKSSIQKVLYRKLSFMLLSEYKNNQWILLLLIIPNTNLLKQNDIPIMSNMLV